MKKWIMMVSAIMTGILAPVSVFASETGTANQAVVTAMQTTANDMIATGTAVVPIALTVLSLGMVVRYGISMFQTSGGKRRP